MDISVPNLTKATIEGLSCEPPSLYEELPRALELLKLRHQSLECQESVDLVLNNMPPNLAAAFSEPRAVMFRQILTPMHDILLFLEKAKSIGLAPLVLEYSDDLFVSAGNRYKRSLGKLPIYQYTGSDGRDMVQYKTIVDFNLYAGKKIGDVKCLDGRSLIEVHHNLFEKITGLHVQDIAIDASSWFTNLGEDASCYYEYLLTLFIRNGILFEILVNNHSDDQFIQKVVAPSFRTVENRLNAHPLIVRLASPAEETRLFWDCYPKEVEQLLHVS